MSQLIRVAKMDRNNFEIFAMNKGLVYDYVEDEEDLKCLTMSSADKSGGYGTEEYLTLCSKTNFLFKANEKWYRCYRYSTYKLGNTTRLPIIYNELNALGFKLVETGEGYGEFDEKSYKKIYKRKDEFIEINIESSWMTIDCLVNNRQV